MSGNLTASNATPKTLGEELARLRSVAGLTLEHIAGVTKVSTRILEALETGSYKHLPEKVFCRNFVRQYAGCVNADPQPLLEAFDVAWERHLLTSGTHPALIVETPEVVSSPIPWRFWVPTGLGVAILTVVAVFILRGTPESPELSPDPRRSVAVRPSPTSVAAMRTLPVPVLGSTVPTQEPEVSQETVLTLNIEVRSGRECWFHIRDRAGLQEQQLLRSGEAAELTLQQPVKLTLGNAGAVTLRVNGVLYPELGGLGEVVHLEVTDSGISALANGVNVRG